MATIAIQSNVVSIPNPNPAADGYYPGPAKATGRLSTLSMPPLALKSEPKVN